MALPANKPASSLMVVIAFGIVYLVWGSTYYFIMLAIAHIPALLMAFMRFFTAGCLLMGYCALKGERIFVWKDMKPAIVTGLLLLLVGNGAVVWVEQYLPSSFVAVLSAASPIWFVVLDKRNWRINFRSRETVIGLVIGFIGVIMLFRQRAAEALGTVGGDIHMVALGVLVVGSICWAGGSLYSKYHSSGPSHSVNTSWQMVAAGISFLPLSWMSGEWKGFHMAQVTTGSWLALTYLIFLGSLAGYSAYVWLLQVRPATQVSTHSYVNPVVAVLLGVALAHEKMTLLQVGGLGVILTSVLLVNLSRYRRERQRLSEQSLMAAQSLSSPAD